MSIFVVYWAGDMIVVRAETKAAAADMVARSDYSGEPTEGTIRVIRRRMVTLPDEPESGILYRELA